jgi:hypothetical protein
VTPAKAARRPAEPTDRAMSSSSAAILIGHTGFVGGNLAKQRHFDGSFNSRNIGDLRNASAKLLVCAGVQAKKWWANQHPDEDWRGIQSLLDVLKTCRVERFVLISTIDVYPIPCGVNEETSLEGDNHAYGVHRRRVEEFVRERFSTHNVIRLPGLFGTGLKKNVIFDLLHDNCIEQINPEASFQYYLLDHLWADIQRCMAHEILTLNIATEPVQTSEIIDRYFPCQRSRVAPPKRAAVTYDMRTIYSPVWDSKADGYLYDRNTVLGEIGEFVSIERSRLS